MSFPTNCNKCNVPFHWDKNVKNPLPPDKRKKEFGWWIEDLTKQLHELERCKRFQASKEFINSSNPDQKVLVATLPSGSVTSTMDHAKEPQVKTLDVVDIAVDKLKREALVDLKVIVAREEVVRDYFKSKGDNNPNPEKVGLYLKLLSDMYRHE